MTTILVIEDHPLFVQSLARLLRDRGKYEVKTVSSAEQALTELDDGTNYDMALIDISLPGESGIDLIGDIHERRPKLPCMMVSGHQSAN